MIRRATADDMPRVWELIQELADFEKLTDSLTGSAEQLASHLDQHFICHVCEVEGQIVAYTLAFPTYSTFRTQPGLWLEDLYVSPDHRKSGIGRRMLEHLVEECRRSGYGRLEWSVLDWNQNAIEFYEHMGATLLKEWRICRVSFQTSSSGSSGA